MLTERLVSAFYIQLITFPIMLREEELFGSFLSRPAREQTFFF